MNALEGLAQFAGVTMLDVDPEKAAADAQAVNGVAPAVATVANQAQSTMGRATEDYSGASATALADHWGQVGGDPMHQTALAMNDLPPVVHGFASVSSAAQVAEATQLVNLGATLKAVIGAGALGAGVAAARTAYARAAIQKIKHTFERGVATRLTPAVERITSRLEGLAPGNRLVPAPAGMGSRISPYAAKAENPAGPMQVFAKFHGKIPKSTTGMTEKEKRKLAKELDESLKERYWEEHELGGSDAGHAKRIKDEEAMRKKINDDLNPW